MSALSGEVAEHEQRTVGQGVRQRHQLDAQGRTVHGHGRRKPGPQVQQPHGRAQQRDAEPDARIAAFQPATNGNCMNFRFTHYQPQSFINRHFPPVTKNNMSIAATDATHDPMFTGAI
ncbi:hypothetical protein [Bifidobacterium leontopitheci]|uniref:hypothetical protein n=1 Tax=Bifidobacterium leontopitheci TaxID=2650774 RepID=UPI0012646295|nr:hypothetical protein [Bifidobacterium leontopitheci]